MDDWSTIDQSIDPLPLVYRFDLLSSIWYRETWFVSVQGKRGSDEKEKVKVEGEVEKEENPTPSNKPNQPNENEYNHTYPIETGIGILF